MPFSLTPRWVFQHYSEITPDWLRQQGITLLRSDLDFTLAAKKTRRPDQSLRDWIAALRNAGIGFLTASNNRSGSRVTEFCADLGVPYQGRAGKPSPRGLEAAMARAGADRVCTAMLGDKLLPDMLAANRAGVLPLMVELFAFIRDFEGEGPGASARDCGNYLDMNLGMAKYLAARYLKVLEQIDSYPESRLEYPQ